MATQTNFPNLKPTLLLDFANAKALDPRISFARASVATCYDSKGLLRSVASGAARFDHDPNTGEPLGLLIEVQRTNLCTYSEDFSSANFRRYNGTVTVNATAAPDGAATADFYQGTGTAPLSMDTYPNDYGSNQGVVQTFSVYVKANGVNTIRLNIGGPDGPVFNLSTGVITPYGGYTAKMQALPNGWFRVSATTTKGNQFHYWGATFNQGASVPVGSGMFVWGWTIENGDFPTSYIPTAASQVTRASEVASLSSANFSSWFTAVEGTLFTQTVIPPFSANTANAPYAARIGTSSSINNTIGLVVNNNGGATQSAVQNLGLSHGVISSGTAVKNAISYTQSLGTASASVNGSIVTATGVTTSFPAYDTLGIGHINNDGRYFWNSTFKKIAFYPKRLTNAQLQALTA